MTDSEIEIVEAEVVTEDQPEPRVYSFPRRYDLATLFVVSLAFSILFGLLRLLSAPAVLVLIVGAFFGWIAFAQAFLFGGTKPRLASVMAGAFFCPSVLVIAVGISVLLEGNPRELLFALCSLPSLALLGVAAGYVAGAFIGGLFIVTEYVRRAVQLLRDR